MMKMRSIWTAVFATAISALVIPACGTNDAGLSGKSGRNSETDKGGGELDDGIGGEGGEGEGDWTDPGELEEGKPEECAADSQKAERMPLDMYIMLDKSGSMAWNFDNQKDAPGGPKSPNARWGAVVNALKTFLDDPASHGMGVGLQYFPNGSQCQLSSYNTPKIPISLLPMASGTLKNDLDNTSPNGGTPTRPALEGALEYARDWSLGHEGHTVIVVLATDGEPSTDSCKPNKIPDVESVASRFLNDHGIKTFVIGIGPEVVNMDKIAAAGGTTKAFPVGGANAGEEFVKAMNEIRGVSLSCDFLIPDAKEGETLDYSKVNMRFTAGNGTAVDLVYVGDASQCGPGGGWFYDDAAAPTKILVCPETCDTFKADGESQVDILLGCKRREPA